MRAFGVVICIAYLTLAIALPAAADFGGTSRLPTPDAEDQFTRFGDGLNPVDRGEIGFRGTVYDARREPLAGVLVKIFVGGLEVESKRTDSAGQYDFKRTIDFSKDKTVTLWFVDATRSLAPKAFLLKESRASADGALWSTCVPRLALERTIESTVYLMNGPNKSALLAKRGCL